MSSPRTGLEGEDCTKCHDSGWVKGKFDTTSQKYEFRPCTCPVGQSFRANEVRRGATRQDASAGICT